MADGFSQYYDEAVEPGKRERACAWATAIGLQDVDGLKPSKYLLQTARRHIEGEITQEEARQLVDEYYETKDGHDLPDDVKEADKVSARMIAIIASPTFNFSVAYYLGLHRQIFDGVFKFAGEVREVELTKREWVLNGDTVQYTPSCMIRDTLEYDFERERKFKYKGLSEDAFVEHFAAFIAGVWQIHPFREGNTRTVGLFAIKYLQSKGYAVTNVLFAEKSYYFRNALVRANYENTRLGVEKTQLPLEEFFKVLIYGYDIELKNRYLRIGSEYGTKTADSIADLHRNVPIDANKLPFDLSKLPIRVPTKRHILLLHEKFGAGEAFSAVQVVASVGIKDRAARNLIALMRQHHLVQPVKGAGKGKVQFSLMRGGEVA